MSLQEIKDQVAKEFFNCNWNTLFEDQKASLIDEVCQLACEETGRLTLKEAEKNAKVSGKHPSRTQEVVQSTVYANRAKWEVSVFKPSITDPSNIVIVK